MWVVKFVDINCSCYEPKSDLFSHRALELDPAGKYLRVCSLMRIFQKSRQSPRESSHKNGAAARV